MDTTDFHEQADSLLEALETALDGAVSLDAELQNGILTIEATAGDFVLNKHEPTRQLWFSSPVTGAARFAQEGGVWRHTVSGEPLDTMLARELGLTEIAL